MWWAENDDVPGLASEAPTLEGLMDRVEAVAGELLSANGAAADEVRLKLHTAPTVQMAWPAPGATFDREVVRLPLAAGCIFARPAKGSHDPGYLSITKRHVTVPSGVIGRHTADAVLKQARLPKAF